MHTSWATIRDRLKTQVCTVALPTSPGTTLRIRRAFAWIMPSGHQTNQRTRKDFSGAGEPQTLTLIAATATMTAACEPPALPPLAACLDVPPWRDRNIRQRDVTDHLTRDAEAIAREPCKERSAESRCAGRAGRRTLQGSGTFS